VFDTLAIISAGAEVLEESLAAAEQERHYRRMHFVNERNAQGTA
jgi:hypothetical protein